MVRHGPRVRAANVVECWQLYWAHWRKVEQAQEREAQRIVLEQDGVLRNAPESVPYREIRREV